MPARYEPGITPAGAGKTFVNSFILLILWDHPRRCGENETKNRADIIRDGSPPQVRGKPLNSSGGSGKSRITPAGAGKTFTAAKRTRFEQDHPRRCGENFACGAGGDVIKGSPPQVRGKPISSTVTFTMCGITPAGAGKTLKRSFRNQPFCS